MIITHSVIYYVHWSFSIRTANKKTIFYFKHSLILNDIYLGLGFLQDSGLCVVADKLNFIRYLSHFRCVHRGADFAKMRTTAVRKLLPESWGFLCPVHTPDGEPCGLMNHLTAVCEVVTQFVYTASIPALLCSLGTWAHFLGPTGFPRGLAWSSMQGTRVGLPRRSSGVFFANGEKGNSCCCSFVLEKRGQSIDVGRKIWVVVSAPVGLTAASPSEKVSMCK